MWNSKELLEHLKSSTFNHVTIIKSLARQDECPESYCRTPGVGVRVHKNFNRAYNS